MSVAMALYPQDRWLSRWVAGDEVQWHGLLARMRRSLANPRRLAGPARVGQPLAVDDLVVTQRALVVGPRLVAPGTTGRVLALHAGRPLVEVMFGAVRVTLANYELVRVGGAGSGNRTRASSLGS